MGYKLGKPIFHVPCSISSAVHFLGGGLGTAAAGNYLRYPAGTPQILVRASVDVLRHSPP